MTTTPETSAETLDVVSLDTETTLEPVSPTPVLISEQEVVFSTAAAALVPPETTPRHWRGTTLIAAIGRIHIGLPSRDRAIRGVRPAISRGGGCLARWITYDGHNADS